LAAYGAEPCRVGPFAVEPFAMTHSIPDSVGLAVRTPVGTVVHTGDFKLDQTPLDGRLPDIGRLAELGAEGVALLFSDSTNVDLAQARDLPRGEVTLITAGSQAEAASALVRIAMDDHKLVRVEPGDAVVLSSRIIPGNERAISSLVNHLYRRGAVVYYDRVARVHVSGHASQEELKLVLNLVRPRHFVPVHGEYRHLVRHQRLAMEVGIPAAGCHLLEDGDVLELD